MALKIVRASEPMTVDQLVVCLYAPPGLGKSTIAFSAEAPLLLDFDHGSHRAANRKDTVLVSAWEDVAHIEPGDLEPFKAVVVDTAGRALDLLSADIIRRNPKMGRGGALTLQGYGQLKSEFTAWLKHLRTQGKDVVLVAHSSEDKNGDDIVERIDMQGGSKGEVYKVADAMGRLAMSPGRKWPMLTFSPSDAAFGKNPGQLEAIAVPDIASEPQFLGGVIQQIKDRLNSLTESQREAQQWMENWRQDVSESEGVDDYNKLVTRAKKAPEAYQENAKRILMQAAKDAGFEFDRQAKKFVAPEPEEAPQEAAG